MNAEFLVIKQPSLVVSGLTDPRHIAWLQKISVIRLVEHYKAVLYVDADVIVRPSAPDIFALMEYKKSSLAMYDEGHLGRSHYFRRLASLTQGSIDMSGSDFQNYYNAGVICITSESLLSKFLNTDDVVRMMQLGIPCPEQTWISYLIQKHQIPCFSLPRSFNFMGETVTDRESRLNAYFIHYAGYSFRTNKKEKRVTVMRKDFFAVFSFSGWRFYTAKHGFYLLDLCQGFIWSMSKKMLRLTAKF